MLNECYLDNSTFIFLFDEVLPNVIRKKSIANDNIKKSNAYKTQRKSNLCANLIKIPCNAIQEEKNTETMAEKKNSFMYNRVKRKSKEPHLICW